MQKTTRKKAALSVAGMILGVLLFFSAGLTLPVLDTKTDAYFEQAITRAGVAYATCRTINASVSIVKESSLQLEPAGVGISLAVGQALDPIDDMTERLSDVLVTAITSLGVQKLAYEIGVSLVPQLLALCLFLLSALVWVDGRRLRAFQQLLLKLLLFVAVFRFCLPLSSMASAFIHAHFFAEQIGEARNELALGLAEIDKLNELALPEIEGILGTIENSATFLKRKSMEFKNAIVYAVSNMGKIIENLLTLTFLYVGMFLIQVVILPLLSFWLLAKLANSLFDTTIPGMRRSLPPSGDTAALPMQTAGG